MGRVVLVSLIIFIIVIIVIIWFTIKSAEGVEISPGQIIYDRDCIVLQAKQPETLYQYISPDMFMGRVFGRVNIVPRRMIYP